MWLYNTEDPFDELDRRVAAAVIHYKLTKADLKNFFYSSGQTSPFKLAEGKKDGVEIKEQVIATIIKEIKERGIELFVIDPFIRCHGVNENDNNAIDIVVQQLTRIASETKCAISIAHHTRKGNDAPGEMDSARGASSLISAARIAHTLHTMSDKEAKPYCISAEDRKWYVRLVDAKMNLAPPRADSRWFVKKSITLNPDHNETTVTLERVSAEFIKLADKDESRTPVLQALIKILKKNNATDVTLHQASKQIFGLKLNLKKGESVPTIRRIIEKFFTGGPVEHSGQVVELTKNRKGHKILRLVKN